MAELEGKGQPIIEIVMPTYVMDPTEDEGNKVCKIVNEVLAAELEGKEYDDDLSKEWSSAIVDNVKARVRKECNFPRYKIIIQCVIGQQKKQDVRIASRCLWNNDLDNHASGQFSSHSLWATCMVFGLYAD